jgi:hypothetical protein
MINNLEVVQEDNFKKNQNTFLYVPKLQVQRLVLSSSFNSSCNIAHNNDRERITPTKISTCCPNNIFSYFDVSIKYFSSLKKYMLKGIVVLMVVT